MKDFLYKATPVFLIQSDYDNMLGMVDIVTVIQSNITAQTLIKKGDTVGVGVSGGVDSMCLLYALNKLKQTIEFSLTALHFDHGIRENASQDIEPIKKFCNENHIQLYTEKADVPQLSKNNKTSLETAARDARYDFFSRMTTKHKLDKIALAHHMDDQAETVLFNLIRGSGTKGLAGMCMMRSPNYIRPMLNIRKSEIAQFAKEQHISFIKDETNDNTAFTRNNIRHTIIPKLTEINTDAVSNIAQAAEILSDEDRLLDRLASEEYDKRVEKRNNELSVKLVGWEKVDVVLKRRMIRMLFDRCFSLNNLEFIHIAVIMNLTQSENGKRVELPGGIIVAKTYDSLTFFSEHESEDKALNLSKTDCALIRFGGYAFNTAVIDTPTQFRGSECFDLDKLKSPVFRMMRDGDYIVPLGMKGKKKISVYLSDRKIPRHKRDRMVMLAEGSEIVWVVGEGISENYKVDSNTKRVFRIRYSRED